MDYLIQKTSGKDLSFKSYSHRMELIDEIFEFCCFSNCDMNFSTFRNKKFIQCDFRHADIGSSDFEHCEFVNCAFEYTSLTNSRFIGCIFENTKEIIKDKDNFEIKTGFHRSSCSNLSLLSSDEQRTKFSNIALNDIGLREGFFSGVDFKGICFKNISLEDSKFDECTFDILDWRSNNVKGVQISQCKIEKMEITLEKLISIIGIEFSLSCKKTKVYLHSKDDSSFITSLNQLTSSFLEETKCNLKSTGGIFEFLNLSILELGIKNKNIDDEFVFLTIKSFLNGNTGKYIVPSNFLYILETLVHYQINSVEISTVIRDLANQVIENRISDKQKALMLYKMEQLRNFQISSHFTIEIINYSSKFEIESRKNLSEFVNTLLTLSSVKESKSISQRSGSIVESVLVLAISFIDNFWQFVFVLTLCGFKFKKNLGDGSVIEFSLASIKSTEINQTKSISINDGMKNEITNQMEKKGIKIPTSKGSKEYNLDTGYIQSKLLDLIKDDEVSVIVKKSIVKELVNGEKINSRLTAKKIK
jgi:fluoroquinolone resistance protein